MVSVLKHYQISSHTAEAEGLHSVKMPQHLKELKIVCPRTKATNKSEVSVKMRYSLLFLFLMMFPTSAGAQYIKWEVGEDIGVATLCRDKNTIMDLARADQLDEAHVIKTFASFASSGLCVTFDDHSPFTVVKTLHNYQDFKGHKSFVLEVVSNKILGFRGYVMARAPKRPSI